MSFSSLHPHIPKNLPPTRSCFNPEVTSPSCAPRGALRRRHFIFQLTDTRWCGRKPRGPQTTAPRCLCREDTPSDSVHPRTLSGLLPLLFLFIYFSFLLNKSHILNLKKKQNTFDPQKYNLSVCRSKPTGSSGLTAGEALTSGSLRLCARLQPTEMGNKFKFNASLR